MYPVWTYGIYLALSVALTVWVARTLFRNGRVFLVEAVSGNELLADSVNHLLVVGFYLVNIGYVATALRYGDKPHDLVQAIELTSAKVGRVLLVLGVMHFVNLYLFSQARKRGLFASMRPERQTPTAPSSSSLRTLDRNSGDQLSQPSCKTNEANRAEQRPC